MLTLLFSIQVFYILPLFLSFCLFDLICGLSKQVVTGRLGVKGIIKGISAISVLIEFGISILLNLLFIICALSHFQKHRSLLNGVDNLMFRDLFQVFLPHILLSSLDRNQLNVLLLLVLLRLGFPFLQNSLFSIN